MPLVRLSPVDLGVQVEVRSMTLIGHISSLALSVRLLRARLDLEASSKSYRYRAASTSSLFICNQTLHTLGLAPLGRLPTTDSGLQTGCLTSIHMRLILHRLQLGFSYPFFLSSISRNHVSVQVLPRWPLYSNGQKH